MVEKHADSHYLAIVDRTQIAIRYLASGDYRSLNAVEATPLQANRAIAERHPYSYV